MAPPNSAIEKTMPQRDDPASPPRHFAWFDLATILLAVGLVPIVGGAAPARAADIDLFTPLSAFVIDAPLRPQAGQQVQTYSPTGPAPTWHISQWIIPGGALPTFTRQRNGGRTVFLSRAAEASVRIDQAADGAASIALSQDGSVLPCTMDTGEPRESDLFVAPSGQHPIPPSRPGSNQPGGLSPALSAMRALTQSMTIKVSTSPATRSKGCAVNQGAVMIAIILHDSFTQPGQTLFYQFFLHGLCGPGTPQRRAVCLHGLHTLYPFSRHNPFGINDNLQLAGGDDLDEGVERHIAIDLLPRLAQAISQGPDAMDHDMSHWRINSAYFGQNIWGDVAVSSTWRAYRLVATTDGGQAGDGGTPDR